MKLTENYISKIKNDSLISDERTTVKAFLEYCSKTNTINYFLDKKGGINEEELKNSQFKNDVLLNLKNSLKFQLSLKAFLKFTRKVNIEVCLIKGAFTSNFIYERFEMRSMRDLDILVHEKDFLDLIKLMLDNGYNFLNSSVNSLEDFNFNYSHQAPILVDKHGVAFEIHHRLKTKPEIKNNDYLALSLLQNKEKKFLFDIPIFCPNINHAFVHCCHHAISKSRLNIGPIFLNDLLQFADKINYQEIYDLAQKTNCERDVDLGIKIQQFLLNSDEKCSTEVEVAIDIIINAYGLPDLFPRKKKNILTTVNSSFRYSFGRASLRSFLFYFRLKFTQLINFLNSYFLKFHLHQKRNKFFRNNYK